MVGHPAVHIMHFETMMYQFLLELVQLSGQIPLAEVFERISTACEQSLQQSEQITAFFKDLSVLIEQVFPDILKDYIESIEDHQNRKRIMKEIL